MRKAIDEPCEICKADAGKWCTDVPGHRFHTEYSRLHHVRVMKASMQTRKENQLRRREMKK